MRDTVAERILASHLLEGSMRAGEEIAKGFARIHKANLINFGVLPLVFTVARDYDGIAQGDRIVLPGIREAVARGDTEITVLVSGRSVVTRLEVSSRQRRLLLAGSAVNAVVKSPRVGGLAPAG